MWKTMACISPITVKKNGRFCTVPCGWCYKCRIDHKKMWSDRLKMELLYNNGIGSFVTLTYNDDYLPQDGGLRRRDLQLYIKRLRRQLDYYKHKTFKYYAIGEYGSETLRCHYHALLLNVDPVRDYEYIKKSWQFGHSMVKGIATYNISYVLKYMDKEIKGTWQKKRFYGDLQPPFALMSQGIGAKYFQDNIDFIRDNHGYYDRGKIVPLPKYWLDKLDVQGQEQSVDYVFSELEKVASSGFMTYNEMKMTEQFRKQYVFDRDNILRGR